MARSLPLTLSSSLSVINPPLSTHRPDAFALEGMKIRRALSLSFIVGLHANYVNCLWSKALVSMRDDFVSQITYLANDFIWTKVPL